MFQCCTKHSPQLHAVLKPLSGPTALCMIHPLTVKVSLGNRISLILTWQHACSGQPLYTESLGHHCTSLFCPASRYKRHSGSWEKSHRRPGGNGIIVGRRYSQLLKNLSCFGHTHLFWVSGHLLVETGL